MGFWDKLLKKKTPEAMAFNLKSDIEGRSDSYDLSDRPANNELTKQEQDQVTDNLYKDLKEYYSILAKMTLGLMFRASYHTVSGHAQELAARDIGARFGSDYYKISDYDCLRRIESVLTEIQTSATTAMENFEKKAEEHTPILQFLLPGILIVTRARLSEIAHQIEKAAEK